MLMMSSTIKYSLIIILLISGAASDSPCNNKECMGPYSLSVPTLPVLNTKWTSQHFTMYYTKIVEAEAFLGYRNRFTKYCYNGGALDPNTGCTTMISPVPPTASELIGWIVREECSYGPVCPRGKDCWGSGAATCFSEERDMHWAKSKDFEHTHEDWKIFAFHTCLMDWECDYKKTSFPIGITIDRGIVKPYVTGDNGDKIILEGEPMTYFKASLPYSFYFTKVPKIYTEVVDITCEKDAGGTHSLCQLPNFPYLKEYSSSIIHVRNNSVGTLGNILLEPVSKVLQEDPHDTSKAASIEDLATIIDTIIFNNRRGNYDTLQIMKEVREIQRKINDLVKSIGKVDDELIGNLLGKQFKTTWFNKDIFKMCPCFQLDVDKSSNCVSNYIYKDGRLVLRKNGEACSSIDAGATRFVSVFTNISHDFIRLNAPPPRGTAASQEGWSWISEKKAHLLDSLVFANDAQQNSSSPLHYILSKTASSLWSWDLWSGLSGSVSWIALIVAIIALIK